MGSHADAIANLKACVAKKSNHLWLGERGLAHVRAGADPKLVERAMKIVLPWYATGACRTLHDAYVPLAWRILEKTATDEATFLRSYAGKHDGERLRAACTWLRDVAMLDPKRRKRLTTLLADANGLAAARAAVVAHGAANPQLLAVLAHDGTADSFDAIVDVAHRAISERGEPLDAMIEWFVPFARGADMTGLAKELVDARDGRGAETPIARMFGNTSKRLTLDVSVGSRQVHVGLTRRASAWIVLTSDKLPHAAVSLSRRRGDDGDYTRWEDGEKKRDENRIGVPANVDDIPRWLAAAATKLKVTWDRSTLLVTSTLRGAARERALDWLLTPPARKKK